MNWRVRSLEGKKPNIRSSSTSKDDTELYTRDQLSQVCLPTLTVSFLYFLNVLSFIVSQIVTLKFDPHTYTFIPNSLNSKALYKLIILLKTKNSFISPLLTLAFTFFNLKRNYPNSCFPSFVAPCYFRSWRRLCDFCPFKDRTIKFMGSRVLYKFTCQCGGLYMGQTRCHFHARIYEHMGISPLTGNNQ